MAWDAIKVQCPLSRRGEPPSHRKLPCSQLILRSFALLLLASWTALAQDAQLQKGLDLVRQGQYAAALPEFEQAERDHPQNPAIENALGIIETKLGHVQPADEHYQKAIGLAPTFEDAHKNLGFNYLTEKHYAPAEEQLKIAASLNPSDSFAHYYLALLYLATNQDQQAVRQLPASRAILQNDPQAAFAMAEACLRLNETSAALPLIDALERRSALSLSQQYQLAVSLFERQSYPQAVDLFRRMVEEDPGSWRNKYNLAIGLLRNHQPAEAASLLEPLAAARSGDAGILNLLGTAYEAEGKPAKALQAYQSAMRTDPTNPNGYLDVTQLLMGAGRFDESEQFIEEGLKVVPNSYALEMRMGAVQMMLGKYNEARESFQKAIQVHPEIPLGYVALAQTYLRREQNQQAADVLAEARQKLPHQFALEYFYGQALLHLNRNSEAAQILKGAVSLKPDVPDAHFQLGMAYLKSNSIGAAQAEFEQALQLDPQDANACYELARIYAKQGETQKAQDMAKRTTALKQKQYAAALKAQSSLLSGTR